ncbi:LOW QUALITY PROTEIN: catechol O-methyltransferase B [Salvelinus alpinus]
MWLSLLSGLIGRAAFLFALYRWVIPTAMQYHGRLALLWHDVIVERALDTLTRTSRPQAVQRKAAVVDPQSVITAIDHFCKHREWAMNVGDEKGAYTLYVFITGSIPDSVVNEVSPVDVLELGTYWGYSTVIARLLPPGACVITLEFNPDYSATARQVIRWSGLEEKVQLVEGASGAWIPRLKEHFGVQAFDLVFRDHWKDCYLPDTKLLEECGLIQKGTVMLADNVICPGTPDYLYVRNSSRYNSHYYRSHLEYTKAENVLEKSVFLGY